MKSFVIIALCLALTACQSSRGMRVYENGQLAVEIYETAGTLWVPGEFVATAGTGSTSATLSIDHGVLGGLGMGIIGAVAGATAAGGGVLP